ncbi:long-chain-fatty-acid--CoA ligase [Halomonas mongoliensis]|uniref:long-chain-fatty-acid--CoA ligase n=1 Tax=Halomonas mongoliensis TaxID=321265 RepID=UPI00403B112F
MSTEIETRYDRVWPAGLPRHLHCPETSLNFNLQAAAARYPHKPAIIFYGCEISYQVMMEEVERLAGYLQKHCEVAVGDRVLLCSQNSPQYLVAYYAILRCRGVVVPVNAMTVEEEFDYYLTDSGARVAIVAQEIYPRLAPLVREGKVLRVVVHAYGDYLPGECDLPLPDGITEPRQSFPDLRVVEWADALAIDCIPSADMPVPDDLAVIGYTSGTTGHPKGCMHSHRTVLAAVAASQAWRGNAVTDVTLAVAPLFHFLGMQGGMNIPLFMGSTVVLLQRWDRDAALLLMERYRVTTWSAPPAMIVDLMAHPGLPHHDVSGLVRLMGGGAAMPEAVARRLQEEFGIRYNEAYGLTETAAFILGNPPLRGKRQCLGIPTFDVQALVVDPVSLEPLPQGEVGEILLSGPQVMLGYWKKPEATEESLIERDGRRFLRTGDLGYIDEEGYFFMVDRIKRMVNASGYKVWPAEIENIMYAHPDIHEACVIAAPDARRGETVKAVVVVRQGREGCLTEDQLIRWCREHMAAYKVPRIIEFVDALPKSATGKIQWRKLQDEARVEANGHS